MSHHDKKAKTVKKAKPVKVKKEKPAGKVVHYFDKIKVAVVRASAPLKVGDKVHIVGKKNDFEQEITSLQVEHEAVKSLAKGKEAGTKVKKVVKEGDLFYKV